MDHKELEDTGVMLPEINLGAWHEKPYRRFAEVWSWVLST